MRKWFLLLLLIVLATLELSWPKFLTFFYARPDLLLILCIAAVFYLDFKTALAISILCGLLKDIFLPVGFGMNTILFAIWCYCVNKLLRQISAEFDFMPFVLVLIVALFNNIIGGLIIVNSGNIVPLGIFLRNLIAPSVYTALVSPLVFKLTKRITA
ncbi:MAG: rod shape-determining protein MreD [Candidatus Omnitrophota bacterium]